MEEGLLAGLIAFAFLTSITPGPNNLLLMSSGALFGWRRTLPHLLGVQVGFAILVVSAVFGLGGVIERWPALVTGVRVLGALWLAWMAWGFLRGGEGDRGASERAEGDRAEREGGLGAGRPISRPFRFHEAVLFQWVNPKAMLLALTGAAAYVGIAPEPGVRVLIIGGVFLVSGTVASTTWTTAGEVVHRALASGRSSRWVGRMMGGLLLVAVAQILLA